ncbi:MAG TPA: hypothetical protein VNM48_02025, partial [Chloroflexota bacterium]|nr:hypothetical protein [Chloroflexota bacterium]
PALFIAEHHDMRRAGLPLGGLHQHRTILRFIFKSAGVGGQGKYDDRRASPSITGLNDESAAALRHQGRF